ncbi:hypothetical protein QYE76_026564 [Lolium multiflorum]|uniref:Retrotransposon gag domain-containing protein n=1 Tax=Lolium multiflorum TaxID=4521 RepID=A0AAD8VVB0_LOLMU|nr:hypothetical protein QYE76_026564 [Lolium multiflorum]
MGLPRTSQYVVGESSGTKKKKKKMRGQVSRNPPWMAEEGELYPTGDTYESLSSYFGMTDLCLGTSSDSDYIPTGRTFIPDGVRKTNRCTGWTPGMTRGNMALVETEEARREREAREKEEADAAARAENAPPPPHPMMHPDFQQYMRAMEEDRRRYQESQSKNMQDFFTHVINDKGPAASWWENLVAVHPPDKVFTWEEFKKKFRDAHVPESVVELKKREFDELRQSTAPIMQYVRDFNRLSRYAPEDVDTEEKRKKRFMKGMNPYMKMQLRLARTAEFQELIDSAITFEDDYRQVQEDRRKRARIEPRKYPISKPTPDRSFKPRFRPTTGSQYNRGGQSQNPINQIICNNCGLRYAEGLSETQNHLLWLWEGWTHQAG